MKPRDYTKSDRKAARKALAKRGSLPAVIKQLRRVEVLVGRAWIDAQRQALDTETLRRLGETARRQIAEIEREQATPDSVIAARLREAQEARP